jgi:hypothetical protein
MDHDSDSSRHAKSKDLTPNGGVVKFEVRQQDPANTEEHTVALNIEFLISDRRVRRALVFSRGLV